MTDVVSYFYFIKIPTAVNSRKAARSTATIVEPTGVPARTEIKRPVSEQITETTAEHIVTERKLLKTRIAERAGKITRAEIRREPTRFIASTMIIAIMIAITRL